MKETRYMIDKVLCVFLIVCVVWGNAITIGEIRVAGLVLTLYRVGIPLVAMYYFCERCRKHTIKQYLSNRIYVIGLIMLLFWTLYGMVLMFVSEYSHVHEGLKEILNVVLGALLIYALTECCKSSEMITFCMKIIGVIVVILSILGVIELIVGMHLRTSRYAWDFSKITLLDGIVLGLSQENLFPVTTIFYGVNDFSAFLAIFFPVLLVEKGNRHKCLRYFSMFMVMLLISVNDANICMLALALMIIILLVATKFKVHSIGAGALILSVQLWVTKLLSSGLVLLKKGLYEILELWKYPISSIQGVTSLIEGDNIGNNMSIQEAIWDQVANASGKTGSLYQRILQTVDAMKMWINSWMLGMGPASYEVYAQEVGGKSKFVNPHNWWLEILSQYGIFVFFFYVGFLIYIFLKCIRQYLKEKETVILRYICILFLYVICSIAPSSFINYSYQWLIVGMGMILVNGFKNEK